MSEYQTKTVYVATIEAVSVRGFDTGLAAIVAKETPYGVPLRDGSGGGKRDPTGTETIGGRNPDCPDAPEPIGGGSGTPSGRDRSGSESLDSLYEKYPNNIGEIDNLVAKAKREATRQNLYGQERVDYIRDYVEGEIGTKIIETTSLSKTSIEHLVSGLVAKYVKGENTVSRNQVTNTVRELVSKYEGEATKKGYTGEEAKAYVRSKVQEAYKRKGHEESNENKASKESSNKEEATTKNKGDSKRKPSEREGTSESSNGGNSSSDE